jgi:hypothetical protein
MNELTLILRDGEGPVSADAAGDVTLGALRDQIQRSFVPQNGNEGSAFLLTARVGP